MWRAVGSSNQLKTVANDFVYSYTQQYIPTYNVKISDYYVYIFKSYTKQCIFLKIPILDIFIMMPSVIYAYW